MYFSVGEKLDRKGETEMLVSKILSIVVTGVYVCLFIYGGKEFVENFRSFMSSPRAWFLPGAFFFGLGLIWFADKLEDDNQTVIMTLMGWVLLLVPLLGYMLGKTLVNGG